MDEGEIFYNIKYIKNPSSLPADLLPRELVISFRKDKIHTELNTPIGNSGVINIVNPEEGIYDTYLNMLSFKYCYSGSADDVAPGFSSMNEMSFRETGGRSVICGLNCREVEVTLKTKGIRRYIWYTDEIKVTNPNAMTPFKEIKGVLMDFFYILGEAEMEFTADEVLVREISDSKFTRKENYRKVSGTFLDSLIHKMIAF